MQKSLILVIVFVVGIGGGLALRLWATGQAANLTGPNQLQVLADGTVIAVGGEHFYVHTAEGLLKRKVATSLFGSEFYIGAFWALDDDTIVLRNDRLMDDSLSTGIKAFKRQRAASLFDGDYTGPGILQRCTLSTGRCESLGVGERVFHTRRIFGLAIDPAGERTVVADTTSWDLLELDSRGNMIRRAPRLFRFPNKVKWGAQGLWVADTNNHRLAKIDTSPNKFGAVQQAVPIPKGPNDDFIWPVSFAQATSNTWFVINSNTDFNASRVDILDQHGARVKSVALPAGADSLDMDSDGQRVLIADFKGFAIHAADLNGNSVTSFGSAEFKQDMAALAQARGQYQLLAYIGLGMMGCVLIGLLVVSRLDSN